MSTAYESWGRYPRVKPEQVVKLYWRDEIPDLTIFSSPVLAYGLGRSYGDCCLNENGVLLDTAGLNRYISFEPGKGLLRCEAGVSFADIVEKFVPRGWFLPVIPGTKFVTVGGAIANDVHGKNHHRAGTFGRFVPRFELLRSTGERVICSLRKNTGLYKATIGGMGLTGLITWAEILLKPIPSAFIDVEYIKFSTLEEFFALSESSEKDFEYSVSWVDCTTHGENLGRGIFMRGNHADPEKHQLPAEPKSRRLTFPVNAPNFLLNNFTVKVFNSVFYRKQKNKISRKIVHYNPYFYPLDAILKWNRMYGKRGFFQYQCVVPFADGDAAIREILERIGRSGNASFLAVLKTFGNISSPGMLSFPRPGVTLALDMPNQGEKSLKLFKKLDEIVMQAGGALYPCKDARMPGEVFKNSYPAWKDFVQYIDPKFSSSQWRRLNIA
ncbi:FAD-binding oxidoreductase [candidate division KSB1 bacterium 4484_188]|nr:MAG: FAD-binding oxidoreductase [candidate division KSB1 bacterium 4484_188]